jgi:periplasmic protein TonB
METSKLDKASLDDIVFEGRNRAYGAYLLRQLYNKHVSTAAIIAISVFALLISIPLIACRAYRYRGRISPTTTN